MAPSSCRSPTLFAFYCGGIVSPVSPCSTTRGREVQPLAALYPTVRLSPWRQVRKNIHSRVWTPGPTWSVLHPGGPPLLVPLSSCTGGYGPHPRRLIRTPVQGGYPRYHSILSPPRRASLLVPLPLDLSASLPPEFLPITFCVFCLVPAIEPLCETTANRKSLLIDALVLSKLLYCSTVWSNTSNKNISRLQSEQNFAARIISGTRKYNHITPALRDLCWFTIKQHLFFWDAVMAFRCMTGQAPHYLSNKFATRTAITGHVTWNCQLFNTPL